MELPSLLGAALSTAGDGSDLVSHINVFRACHVNLAGKKSVAKCVLDNVESASAQACGVHPSTLVPSWPRALHRARKLRGVSQDAHAR